MGCLKHEENVEATFLYGDTNAHEYSVHHWVRAWEPYVAANKQIEGIISNLRDLPLFKKRHIRPDLKNSNREAHKLLRLALDAQIDGDIEKVILLCRNALFAESHEKAPDRCTIAYAKYLLAHYLLVVRENWPEALSVIDDIIAFEEIKDDEDFYSDVLIEKAKALALTGKVIQARSTLCLVNYPEKASFLEANGYVLFFEGNIEQTVETLQKGINTALKKFSTASTNDDKKAYYQHYYACLTQLGMVYQNIQRPDLSLELWKKAVTVAEEIGWEEEKGRSLLPYIECLIQYEKLDDALIKLEDAYEMKKHDNDNFFFWQYYNLKASIYIRRNNPDQNDVQKAIDSLRELLERNLEPRQAIGTLRYIADLQAENGMSQAAFETLKTAEQIIGTIEDKEKYQKDIEVQYNDIKIGSRPLGESQYRPTILSPSRDALDNLIDKYHLSEVSLERLSLAFEIGMGLIDIDPALSFSWLEESAKQANRLWNKPIEAHSLIGQAWILFKRKTAESEDQAKILIDKALSLMDNIPIWHICARATMFKGMSFAHKEDFKNAYKFFQDAKQIIDLHRINDRALSDFISAYLDECERILSRRLFTDLDFDIIISEINEIESWFPKYSKELRQFLWYNRHEDIERLITTTHGSKAFMITDSKEELDEWINGLSALFDTVSYTSETDYHTEQNWNFATMLPVPKNIKSNYVNVFSVLHV